MTADFPFHDGQRFLIEDEQEHVHTVVCRRVPAKPVSGGTGETSSGLALTTAGGLPVLFRPKTGKFRIPVLGRDATRRATV